MMKIVVMVKMVVVVVTHVEHIATFLKIKSALKIENTFFFM